MGTASPEQISGWLAAAGKSANVSSEVRERIIIAGQFIENSMRRTDASSLLRGIDFSKPVRVCNRLPDGIYVQFVDHHFGSWFTHIGLRPDQVGLAEGQRKPERFRPVGVVAGLESTASAVKDYWTKGVVHESLDPTSGRRGQLTQGGGAQYLVLNRFQMEQV
jgi:hypothetical protein